MYPHWSAHQLTKQAHHSTRELNAGQRFTVHGSRRFIFCFCFWPFYFLIRFQYGLCWRRNGWGFLRLGLHQCFLCGFCRWNIRLIVRQNAGQETDDQGKYQQEGEKPFMDFYSRLKQLPSKTKKGPCIQSINDGRRGLGDNLYDQRNAVIFRRTQKSPAWTFIQTGLWEVIWAGEGFGSKNNSKLRDDIYFVVKVWKSIPASEYLIFHGEKG